MEHYKTDTSEVNFDLLKERLEKVNNPLYVNNINLFNNGLLKKLNEPTLIVATGGSIMPAIYLNICLENMGLITEIIEPRDYFYKNNLRIYKNLVIISNSGKSNGIADILKDFNGEKFLICGNYIEYDNTNIIPTNNETYQNQEQSFISLVPSISIMMILAEIMDNKQKKLNEKDIIEFNKMFFELMDKASNEMNYLKGEFTLTPNLEILTGYDTYLASSIIESNMSESGTIPTIIHDKGEFCHGRSNLMYHFNQDKVIYLYHTFNSFDEMLTNLLESEYHNVIKIGSDNVGSIYLNNLYLAIKMYYLSKVISEDKNIDLTCPDYNRNVIKKVYKYRGEM